MSAGKKYHVPTTISCGKQRQNTELDRQSPKKWDKTDILIEIHQFHKYGVRIDGSGRVTTMNRKFLRK